MTQTATKKLINPAEIRRSWNILFQPGQVVEIRILEASTKPDARYTDTLGGYFDNVEDVLKALSQIRKVLGCYITLQTCNPDLLGRACNKLIKQKKDYSTPDKYITRYRWLPIDCDPERISLISSTDEQHERALQHSRYIQETLRQKGWPDPLMGDSGNGAHLLYPIDLGNTPENTELLKHVLEGLAARFDIEGLHIDQTVFNPSRIWKLYGTLACKGDDTPKWPHRMSRLLEVPETFPFVSRELLEKIAAPAQVSPAPIPNNTHTHDAFDMDGFIRKHHIDTFEREVYQGGYRWVLKQCPFCQESDRGACLFLTPSGAAAFRCQHNRCTGKDWYDFRPFFEPDAYTRKKDFRTYQSGKDTAFSNGNGKDTNDVPGDTLSPGTEEPVEEKQEKEDSQAQKLVSLALQQKEKLFMTPKGEMYIRLRVNGHVETLPIGERGGAFKRWLVYRYLDTYGVIPNANALTQAITALEATAQWGGEKQQETYIRVASHEGNIYLDLANEQGDVVKITSQGWSFTQTPPVCFRHPEGMLPLPRPVHGGSLDELQPFVNARGNDWILIKAFLLGMLHPTGPYPILDLNGEKGTAKSSTARRVRMIIDPHQAPLRREPKDDQAFAIMAQNNYVVAFDNLSHISSRFSDLLCTLSTGAGDAYRKHYSNDEECIFSAMRPQIFTGIEDLATRGDLIDRCINIKLQPIEQYKDEATLKREFEAAHPRILGALLDVVCVALRNLPEVKAGRLPRMADFAMWVLAAEEHITGKRGTFLEIYRENMAEGIATEIEASPVGGTLVKFVDTLDLGTSIEETASDLLAHLKEAAGENTTKSKSWPQNARALSGALKRLAPSLRAKGIHVEFKRRDDGRYIAITKRNDANLPRNDAKCSEHDANFASENGASPLPTSQNSQVMTQNDAKFGTFPSPVQKEKKEKVERERVGEENGENLRHFASASLPTGKTCEICRFNPAVVIWAGGLHYCQDCQAKEMAADARRGR